jgi:hypothetical protein
MIGLVTAVNGEQERELFGHPSISAGATGVVSASEVQGESVG